MHDPPYPPKLRKCRKEEPGLAPGDRAVLAMGEAKVGETLDLSHLGRLEEARRTLGARAAEARLLLIGPTFSRQLRGIAATRTDVELVDLDRLYGGA